MKTHQLFSTAMVFIFLGLITQRSDTDTSYGHLVFGFGSAISFAIQYFLEIVTEPFAAYAVQEEIDFTIGEEESTTDVVK